jgi:endonuclease III
MAATPHTLSNAIALLRTHYGAPEPLPTAQPFELVLWENVAYLAPRARRHTAFTQLKNTIGTSPGAILAAKKSALDRVTAHGILKGDCAAKLRECARIAIEEFGGDLDAAARGPLDAAKRALRRFPGIGEPGAEKILLFAGYRALLAPDSNGLRVMVRLGLVKEDRSYTRRYASCRTVAADGPLEVVAMQTTHLLLQQHGQTLCKRTAPRCGACPLAGGCQYARTDAKK